MNTFARNKLIHTAVAAPGAGKTEALIRQLPALLTSGKRFLLALPTLVLSSDVTIRCSAVGLKTRVIDSTTGTRVGLELNAALLAKHDNVIICTHESLQNIDESVLAGWALVVDELPKVVDFPDYPMKPIELARLLTFIEERDNRLWIRDHQLTQVKEQVQTNQADAMGTGCSTLGTSGAHIFQLLLDAIPVFIDTPQSNGIRHVRSVEEIDWWSIFQSADEVHVLAANVSGSLFEQFAQVHGFEIHRSMFTPEARVYTCPVTLLPVMPKGRIFSKALVTAPFGNERVFDFILQEILTRTEGKPLLFTNKWAGLKGRNDVLHAPVDCRGLNGYDTTTEAILLFGGNPSPSDERGLEYLEKKYGRSFSDAFITTRFLEPSLQAVTRTAIRRRDNTSLIRLYVQDGRVVRYLLETYLSHAEVDWSVSWETPVPEDGRKTEHVSKKTVLSLIRDGQTNTAIERLTGVSRKTIRKWREELTGAITATGT
ncbi:DEAD/DEAH box helicase [Pseudomonas sp. CC6-YY-74]|uniref:DEAD/DEAH box helicase n=1 Tax=Pseudomonas sp. CC6-YY-74 TaxID=1930532 RepID=UPI0009A1A6AC|nr:DEAD/DEAH box helicase [Pseudomonas sp. CC6-YY-74]